MRLRAQSFLLTLVALTVASVCGSVPANASPYLWISGLRGDVTKEGHEGWIDVTSYSVSVTGKACRGVRVVKPVDGVSESLFIAANRGRVFEEARLDAIPTSSQAGLVRLRMRDAVISSIQLATGTSGETIETLQFTAALVIVEFESEDAGDKALRTVTESRMSCRNAKAAASD